MKPAFSVDVRDVAMVGLRLLSRRDWDDMSASLAAPNSGLLLLASHPAGELSPSIVADACSTSVVLSSARVVFEEGRTADTLPAATAIVSHPTACLVPTEQTLPSARDERVEDGWSLERNCNGSGRVVSADSSNYHCSSTINNHDNAGTIRRARGAAAAKTRKRQGLHPSSPARDPRRRGSDGGQGAGDANGGVSFAQGAESELRRATTTQNELVATLHLEEIMFEVRT